MKKPFSHYLIFSAAFLATIPMHGADDDLDENSNSSSLTNNYPCSERDKEQLDRALTAENVLTDPFIRDCFNREFQNPDGTLRLSPLRPTKLHYAITLAANFTSLDARFAFLGELIVMALIRMGEPIDIADALGNTPLHAALNLAVTHPDLGIHIIQHLLNPGNLTINKHNINRQTPLQLALNLAIHQPEAAAKIIELLFAQRNIMVQDPRLRPIRRNEVVMNPAIIRQHPAAAERILGHFMGANYLVHVGNPAPIQVGTDRDNEAMQDNRPLKRSLLESTEDDDTNEVGMAMELTAQEGTQPFQINAVTLMENLNPGNPDGHGRFNTVGFPNPFCGP
jgi:hypothetical protein